MHKLLLCRWGAWEMEYEIHLPVEWKSRHGRIKHWNYSDCFLIKHTEASALQITHLWPLERLPPGGFVFMLKLATIIRVNVLKVHKGQALLLIGKICV